MKLASQILAEAKELISSPEKWTKGAMARDIHGAPLAYLWPLSDNINFCLLGAITCILRQFDEQSSLAYEAIIEAAGSPSSIIDWNDDPSRTHEEVMEVLRNAICIAKSKETT